jgi:hypothetical protein
MQDGCDSAAREAWPEPWDSRPSSAARMAVQAGCIVMQVSLTGRSRSPDLWSSLGLRGNFNSLDSGGIVSHWLRIRIGQKRGMSERL